MCGVSREVDQDINTIFSYSPGQVFVGKPHRRIPSTAATLDPFRQRIGAVMTRIGEEFDAIRKMGCQRTHDTFNKVTDRMALKITGNQTHTQTSFPHGTVFPRPASGGSSRDEVAITTCIGH